MRRHGGPTSDAAAVVDLTIALFLLQDGITNGAIYALLGLALVLVFAVTRVIFVPQGEFVTLGAMTYAVLQTGAVPGTVWLLAASGGLAFLLELWARRARLRASWILRQALFKLALPLAVVVATFAMAGSAGPAIHFLLTLLIIGPLGPYLYRVAFEKLAESSVLTLLIAAVGVHLAMVAFGLIAFGPEGLRAPPLSDYSLVLGPVPVSGQSLAVYGITIALILGLYLFFEHTLQGKALQATAMDRLGARLIGIRATICGRAAFALAAAIGAISGILVVPTTTIYYDTGFIIGLKGFVAAIIGALVSYPVTALAALGVGIVEALASFFASDFKEIIVFLLILPVLAWRSLRASHAGDEE